jgi:hypothetical protein
MEEEYGNTEGSFNTMNLKKFIADMERANKPELAELAKSEFKQQNMPAWRPIPTLGYSICMFLVVIIVCLPLGIGIISKLICNII